MVVENGNVTQVGEIGKVGHADAGEISNVGDSG